MTLRQLRKQKGLTQVECAKYLGVPLRTYQNYETDAKKAGTIKYSYMMDKLVRYGYVDEETGVLTIEQITAACKKVFENLDINYCYLFGSYAKGKAVDTSDVDLLVSTSISGIRFYDLVEALREELHKKVDVLTQDQLRDNLPLVEEIMKDGVKIYG